MEEQTYKRRKKNSGLGRDKMRDDEVSQLTWKAQSVLSKYNHITPNLFPVEPHFKLNVTLFTVV
jgi:hypothetical protein